jgi:hypothetical protein
MTDIINQLNELTVKLLAKIDENKASEIIDLDFLDRIIDGDADNDMFMKKSYIGLIESYYGSITINIEKKLCDVEDLHIKISSITNVLDSMPKKDTQISFIYALDDKDKDKYKPNISWYLARIINMSFEERENILCNIPENIMIKCARNIMNTPSNFSTDSSCLKDISDPEFRTKWRVICIYKCIISGHNKSYEKHNRYITDTIYMIYSIVKMSYGSEIKELDSYLQLSYIKDIPYPKDIQIIESKIVNAFNVFLNKLNSYKLVDNVNDKLIHIFNNLDIKFHRYFLGLSD